MSDQKLGLCKPLCSLFARLMLTQHKTKVRDSFHFMHYVFLSMLISKIDHSGANLITTLYLLNVALYTYPYIN